MITHDTYQRWYNDLTRTQASLSSQVDRLSRQEEDIYRVLMKNVDRLTDLKSIYEGATIMQKHTLINQGFDSNHTIKTVVIEPRPH
ncbi:hypothetical protein DXN05_01965 [Deminuibacter soli]|uniref:Uncharacterized protein n=1 Tax=Deminuibacter soli TaxID=2291815 RepID=A0A3E1NPD7_9BACT|nr:hypothetical protein DXN05_01965 [Deminuibacter soli]